MTKEKLHCSHTTIFDIAAIGKNLSIKIDFTFTPGRPGVWYKKNGDPGDAPESPEFDTLTVSHDEKDITTKLTETEMENLENKLFDEIDFDDQLFPEDL